MWTYTCSCTWKLSPNLSEYKVAHFCSSSSRSSSDTYLTNNTPIACTSQYRHLGVIFSDNLSYALRIWIPSLPRHSKFCSSGAGQPQLTIPLRPSFSCTSHLLVRSQIAYCRLWRLHTIRDICSLERIQRKATKFIQLKATKRYRVRHSVPQKSSRSFQHFQ